MKNSSCLSEFEFVNRTYSWKIGQNGMQSQCYYRNNKCPTLKKVESEKTDQMYKLQFTTIEKAPCIFPFKYKGEIYNTCIKDGYEEFWCATDVDDNSLELKHYGYCYEGCPTEDTTDNSWLVIIIVTTCICFLLMLSLITVGYCHFKKKKKNTDLFEKNGEKEFDVFISYSSHDKNFVEDVIGPELENETSLVKYKCLLHGRDFKTSTSIMDQIEKAIDSSSCTIVILSKDFLKSQWAVNG